MVANVACSRTQSPPQRDLIWRDWRPGCQQGSSGDVQVGAGRVAPPCTVEGGNCYSNKRGTSAAVVKVVSRTVDLYLV